MRPHVRRSIVTNMFNALQAKRVDVFAVMRASDVDPKVQRFFDHARVDATRSALEEALTSLSPRAIQIDVGNSSEVVYNLTYNPDCRMQGFIGVIPPISAM